MTMTMMTTLFCILLLAHAASGALLVGNTRGDYEITEIDGNSTLTLLDAMDGLEAPDHIVEKDGYYYISTGTTNVTSSIAKYEIATGDLDLEWASGGPLMRPYGFDFSEDGILYVASFMSDQILMYDGETGEYMGVFAQGDATEEGLCNGPNQIAIYNGTLCMTTQGSYIDENGDLQYAFASQIVQYDLESGEGSVFAPQPEPIGGFVSMLGIWIIDEVMYTTDFAGGLRTYSMEDGSLIDSQPTAYVEGALTGSITTDGSMLYVTGFVGEEEGAVMMFEMLGDGLLGEMEVMFEGEPLARPIGILFVNDSDDTSGGTDALTEAPTSAAEILVMHGWLLASVVGAMLLTIG